MVGHGPLPQSRCEKEIMIEKAAKIKLLILDVDGVLTDGLLYYTGQGEHSKSFYVRDGLGMRLLMEHGIEIALITGRTSEILASRSKELGIKYVYQGRVNKLEALQELMSELDLNLEEVAFMGDDIIDLPILSRVGLASCPANAHDMIRPHVNFISQYKGGRGAVRELCDLILTAQNKLASILTNTLEEGRLFKKAESPC